MNDQLVSQLVKSNAKIKFYRGYHLFDMKLFREGLGKNLKGNNTDNFSKYLYYNLQQM